jgi:hypothetical protein
MHTEHASQSKEAKKVLASKTSKKERFIRFNRGIGFKQ